MDERTSKFDKTECNWQAGQNRTDRLNIIQYNKTITIDNNNITKLQDSTEESRTYSLNRIGKNIQSKQTRWEQTDSTQRI